MDYQDARALKVDPAPAGARNRLAWFAWLFPVGETVVLPTNLNSRNDRLTTLANGFKVHPPIKDETP